MAFADPTDLELMLSELRSQLPSVHKSGNIYSRYLDKERELHLLRQKYLECSEALIESHNKAERLQSMMLEKEKKYLQKKEEHNNSAQPSLSKDPTIQSTSASMLVEDGTANYSVRECGRTRPQVSEESSLSDDVEHDGETLSLNKRSLLITESSRPRVAGSGKLSVVTTQGYKTAVDSNTTPCQETKRSERCDVPPRSLVSEDLLQKVMQQNMRLKKGVRKIIETRGLTVDEYLERQEYIEAIKLLRLERDTLQSRVAELDAYASSSENKLLQNCMQLDQKIHGLEHAAIIRQAIVDVYSTELNKLRQETKTSNGGLSKESSTESPISASETKLFMKKVLENLAAMKTKCDEMEALYRDKCTVSAELQTRVNDLEEQNERLKADLQQLQRNCEQSRQQIQRGATSDGAVVLLPSTGLMTDCDPVLNAENYSSQFECQRCQKPFTDAKLLTKHVEKCTSE